MSGQADVDGDRVVRASEAIDYVSRRVPELTDSQQHPRVAGTFDARLALASSELPPPPPRRVVTLEVTGPAGSAVYLDNAFRGSIRPAGSLRVDALQPGPHVFSADFPDGSTLNGAVSLPEAPSRVAIAPPGASPLTQLRARVKAGRVLEANGAWEFYRSQSFTGPDRAAAQSLMTGTLEEYGQACVSDYVQSTATGLKRAMLQRALDAFDRLQTIRPDDGSIETRKLFCRGRLMIAESRFAEAVVVIQQSLKRDPRFACAYNALGVALARINRPAESRQAFETAAKLTPEWGLPPFQIAQQLVTAGELGKAVPYLERAVTYNPRSAVNRWNLAHVLRLSGNAGRAEREAAELIRLSRTIRPPIWNWARPGRCSAARLVPLKRMTAMCCWLPTTPAPKRCVPAPPACVGSPGPRRLCGDEAAPRRALQSRQASNLESTNTGAVKNIEPPCRSSA